MDRSSEITSQNPVVMPNEVMIRGFKSGEAEQIVMRLRDCLRRNDEREAKRRFAEFSKRLAPFIAWNMEARLGRRHRDLVEDAVVVAITMLWERLADLRPLAGLRHFELRFHQSLATTLSDAYKQMTTKKYGQYETLESETFIVEGTEVLEDISVLALATEEKATLTFESVLDAMSAAELQGRVGDPRHAEALRREIAGDSREEIAARLGCSVKTVYLWTESAKSVLKEYIEENYWPGRPER